MKLFELTRAHKEQLQIIGVYLGLAVGLITCAVTNEWYLMGISILIATWHGIFGNNIALHRLFSHRSFTTTRPKEIFLAISTIFLGSNGPITYCAIHRHHHLHSDAPRDPHSPHQSGFWYIGLSLWAFRTLEQKAQLRVSMPKDLMRDPVLKFIELNYHAIWLAVMAAFYLLGGWTVLLYGLLVPAGLYVLIANIGTNVISHSDVFNSSYRNFDTDDQSRNSNFVQLLTMGEGYQNNHHLNCTTCSQAFKPGEFDPSGWLTKKLFAIDFIEVPQYNK